MFLARTLTTFLVLSFTFNPSALSANSQPLIVGHRGVSLDAPENTLSNFRACLALRIGFEFDVRRSKDGVLVCIHDANVRRTTNGAGKVAELAFAKIRKLDAGSWYDRRFAGEKVPSIEEILQIIAADSQFDVLIAVDIKVDGVATKVVELAETYGVLDKLLFTGRARTEPLIRAEIAHASSKAKIAVMANSTNELGTAINTPNATHVCFRYLPTKEEIATVRKAGRHTYLAASTIEGDVADNWRIATVVGIESILTDYPLAMRRDLYQSSRR